MDWEEAQADRTLSRFHQLNKSPLESSILMRIEIICTGDEVLSGKTLNTNYSHMARRLQEVGLDVEWGTTVGDDRPSLTDAFAHAAGRADAVIVNGGLGPTVDDLSQEVAAEAAGVELELDEGWLANIQSFYERRGRVMPPNNRKQAMLPQGAEFIDNPIGTACGFAIDIGKARFFFTPGVPRELHKMLDEQIIPRLLARSGSKAVVMLKRFHSFGLGESRVDDALQGVEFRTTGGEIKLGFQAHYPQLETKIFARGTDAGEMEVSLQRVADAVRDKLGAYIVAEDAQTLEGNVVAMLVDANATIAVAEAGTFGAVAGRLLRADTDGLTVSRATLGGDYAGLAAALEVEAAQAEVAGAHAAAIAEAVRESSGATLGLAVLTPTPTLSGEGWAFIAVSRDGESPIQRTSCLVGGPDRTRAGGVEMGLDCVRRALQGLAVEDLIDFEKRPVGTEEGR